MQVEMGKKYGRDMGTNVWRVLSITEKCLDYHQPWFAPDLLR